MEQPDLFASAPAVDPRSVSPTWHELPPWQGKTQQSAHASYTGARQAVKTYGAKVSEYLQILANGGPISDHAAAALMQCGLSSICSIRNSLIDRALAEGHEPPIVPDGFDAQEWADGGVTRRTRWRLNW